MSAEPGSDARITATRERLHRSRAELWGLVHEINGGPPEGYPDEASGSKANGGFPRSRLMRALTSRPARMAFAAAALALIGSRRGMGSRLTRLAPLLRPLLRPMVMRFVLRRLVG